MTSTVEMSLRPVEDRWRQVWLLFTVTWSVAVLFHLAGNARLAPEWGRALLGVAAVAALARPGSARVVAALAVAVLVNVWLEAPLLGNHWLLHGLIAVLILIGVGASSGDGPGLMRRAVGPLRLLLVAFYVFAASAKLNSDFFDPAVSCGLFYLDESVRSWGLGEIGGWSPVVRRAVTVFVAGIELSIPVLLTVRRTRSIGVVVALAFHFVLALDRTHQFFDFSAVLVALFLLFLPPDGISEALALGERVRASVAARWASGPELLRIVALAGALLVVFVASGPGEWPAPPLLRSVGVVAWMIYGIGAIALAVGAARLAAGSPAEMVPAGSSVALLAVPLLAVLNGLTPYVELKTAASWNMYSNLSIVDGDSNHLLVPAGVVLSDAHERLVEITEARGVDLDFYIGTGWRLPEVMLTDHLADRRGAIVLGRVGDEEVRYVGGDGGSRPLWQQKLQVFRAVDGPGPVACQTSFGPAR